MSGKKIVVIDDDPEIRAAMSRILAGYDYEVFTAEDGSKGLELVAKENPSIVLTDIKMPGMDGIEVLRRVKERSPDAEVIVVTGGCVTSSENTLRFWSTRLRKAQTN
jgi:CheY-like chemotaxis protein